MQTNGIIKIAHRGASGYEPENTLRSFLKALELKADMVELDVRLSADNVPVVIHDDTPERTTSGSGYVAEKTFEELRALDAGKGEKIPSLKEVFDAVAGKAKIDIELKDRGALKAVAALIEEYVKDRGSAYDDFLVSSFNHLELWELKGISPLVPTGALIAAVPPGFADFAKEMKVFSVNVEMGSVSKGFVEEVHEREIKVFAYTANLPEDIERMKSLGVDGICSDFPDRL
ncbi:MAG: glycerophosphodiester phosphodiesterase [Endomicrobiales bacterium]